MILIIIDLDNVWRIKKRRLNDKDDHSCSRRFNYQCQKNNERRDGIFSGTFDTAIVDGSKTAVRPVSSDTVQFALLIPRRHKTRFESDNETHSRTGKGAFRGIYVDLDPYQSMFFFSIQW